MNYKYIILSQNKQYVVTAVMDDVEFELNDII